VVPAHHIRNIATFDVDCGAFAKNGEDHNDNEMMTAIMLEWLEGEFRKTGFAWSPEGASAGPIFYGYAKVRAPDFEQQYTLVLTNYRLVPQAPPDFTKDWSLEIDLVTSLTGWIKGLFRAPPVANWSPLREAFRILGGDGRLRAVDWHTREDFGRGTCCPFCPSSIEPHWATLTVTEVARSIHQGQSAPTLPVLADALEEAHCSNGDVLACLRGCHASPGNCVVLDLLKNATGV
jgi:hypothetical protein